MTSHLLYPLYTLALFLTFLWLRKLIKVSPARYAGTTILLAVLGGYLIDNLIISTGMLLGKGEMLAALNLGRWWLRILLPPFLLAAYVETSGRLGLTAARTTVVAAVSTALVFALVAAQAWPNWPLLQDGTLHAVNELGMLYYVPSGPLVLPGTLAATIIGAVFGLLMLFKGRWPWVLLITTAILAERFYYPQPDFVAAALDVLLMGVLVWTEARAQREGLRINRKDLDNRFERLG